MKADNLKPCPFCGGSVRFGLHDEYRGKQLYTIGCNNEDCIMINHTGMADTKYKMKKLWNQRACAD